MAPVEPLPPADQFGCGESRGIYPQMSDETKWLAVEKKHADDVMISRATALFSVERLLRPDCLVPLRVAALRPETAPSVADSAVAELTRLVGGLIDEETRSRFQAGRLWLTTFDEPGDADERREETLYYAAFKRGRWRVQATGEPGVFHSVAFWMPIDSAVALDESGNARPHPLGSVDSLLAELAPNLGGDRDRLRLSTFDIYEQGEGWRVVSGVRYRITSIPDASGGEPHQGRAFAYVVRVDIDLTGRFLR